MRRPLRCRLRRRVSQLMFDRSHLAPIPDRDWPSEIADLRDSFAGSLNVYRVMAHHPALLRAWQDYREHVVVRSTLGRQRSEVVILRTGHRLHAEYEWAHHVIRARGCGIDDQRIAAMRGPLAEMTPEDTVLARAVDDLIDHARLGDAALQPLDTLIGSEGVLDLMATVGLYSTLAFIVKTYEVHVESDVAAALAKQPAP